MRSPFRKRSVIAENKQLAEHIVCDDDKDLCDQLCDHLGERTDFNEEGEHQCADNTRDDTRADEGKKFLQNDAFIGSFALEHKQLICNERECHSHHPGDALCDQVMDAEPQCGLIDDQIHNRSQCAENQIGDGLPVKKFFNQFSHHTIPL